MAWGAVATAVVGVAGAAVRKPLTPTGANGGLIDNSGWNVNMGSGSITSSASKQQERSALNWVMIGGALIGLALLVRAWKSR